MAGVSTKVAELAAGGEGGLLTTPVAATRAGVELPDATLIATCSDNT